MYVGLRWYWLFLMNTKWDTNKIIFFRNWSQKPIRSFCEYCVGLRKIQPFSDQISMKNLLGIKISKSDTHWPLPLPFLEPYFWNFVCQKDAQKYWPFSLWDCGLPWSEILSCVPRPVDTTACEVITHSPLSEKNEIAQQAQRQRIYSSVSFLESDHLECDLIRIQFTFRMKFSVFLERWRQKRKKISNKVRATSVSLVCASICFILMRKWDKPLL